MTMLCVCVPGNTPAHAGHCFRVSFVNHPPLCSYTCMEKCSGTSRTPFSQLLGPGRFCFLPAPCEGEGGPAGSVHLALVLNALAPGFIAYYCPGMCPCFDLSFLVFCGLAVQPSSVAPLTGPLENRTPFVAVLIPRERRKLQVPTGLPLVSKTNCLTLSSS